MLRRGIAISTIMVAVAAALTGCVSSSQTCVSWAAFDTPADAMTDADAVVVGRIADPAGTAPIFGADAAVWTVDVDAWLSGSADGAEIEVLSTPETCTGGAVYRDGDPFAAAGDDLVVLFLHRDEGRWRTITPMQGIVEASPDGAMPENWPDSY